MILQFRIEIYRRTNSNSYRLLQAKPKLLLIFYLKSIDEDEEEEGEGESTCISSSHAGSMFQDGLGHFSTGCRK